MSDLSKICSICKVEKQLSHFYQEKRALDGKTSACKQCLSEYSKIYRAKNKNEIIERKRQYRIKNRDSILQKKKKYRENNKEKIAKAGRKYRNENKDKIRKYFKDRFQNDKFYVFKEQVRQNIKQSFARKSFKKGTKTRDILGCSYQFFKEYLEAKFKNGMNWDNRHLWHLDHIIPLAEAKTKEDVVRLCHYSNYQPLWAEDNLMKSNKIEEGIQLVLI